LSPEEARWSWPAVTLTDLATKDWRACSAIALRLHNPTDKPQQIGLCVRDSDKARWTLIETFAPGETRVLSAPIDELRTNVLVSDIWTLTLWTHKTTAPQTFLVSPIYLIAGSP